MELAPIHFCPYYIIVNTKLQIKKFVCICLSYSFRYSHSFVIVNYFIDKSNILIIKLISKINLGVNMLIEFSCSNFRSICSEVTLSMKVPEQDLSDSRLIGNHYSRITEIYGANGTGKTTILQAICYITYMVRGTINQLFKDNKKTNKLPYFPHKANQDKPTLFNMFFINNDRKYYYELSYTEESFITECLYYLNNSDKPNSSMKLIFEKKNHKYKFGHDFKNVLEPLVTSLPENELLLSFAGKSHIDNKIIFDAFDFFLNGIEIHQAKDNYSRRQDSIKRLDENEEIKKKYIDFMKSIDETFENCDIIWISNENKYYVRNKYRGFDKSIDIEEESSGIQNLFDSMSTIFSILDEGKIFICDEWERTFHPLIIKELIKKFLYNKKSNAQIIITTHCTDLLDNTLLRNDQIWFTNLKTENRETELYALSDFKGIESFDDIRNDYLAGRYGAIPLLDEMTKEEN